MYQASVTPTAHEKREWSRLAQAAYGAGLNSIGHRFSGAAALRTADTVQIATFDSLQSDYRAWLIDGFRCHFGECGQARCSGCGIKL